MGGRGAADREFGEWARGHGAGRYVLGTLRGESLRLVTLAAGSSADTVSVLTAPLAGDSLVGSYDSRFATTGARGFRRIAR